MEAIEREAEIEKTLQNTLDKRYELAKKELEAKKAAEKAEEPDENTAEEQGKPSIPCIDQNRYIAIMVILYFSLSY